MIQTDVIGVDETIQLLQKKTDALLATVQREIETSALRTLADSKRTLTAEGKRATGRLHNSGKRISKPGEAKVLFDSSYAYFVEHGRRAGKRPPVDEKREGGQSLMDWVKKRGLASDPKDIKQIAFLIARKIGRTGIKATPFLYPAFMREKVKLMNRLRKI